MNRHSWRAIHESAYQIVPMQLVYSLAKHSIAMYILTMNTTNYDNRRFSRDELLEVIREHHVFPGAYPITVIARSDSAFFAMLHSLLEELQGESTFQITERPSSKQNYASYRIEIYVESAETALYRRERIGAMDGVLMLL